MYKLMELLSGNKNNEQYTIINLNGKKEGLGKTYFIISLGYWISKR